MPAFDDEGNPVDYSGLEWEQEEIPGYETSSTVIYDGDEKITIFSNVHRVNPKNVTTQRIKVNWDDNNNEFKRRPSSLTFTLNSGESVTLNEANGWSGEIPDLPHRREDRALRLAGREDLERFLAGQLDVDAQPVGEQAQPRHQLRGGPRDRLGVDVTVEAVLAAQQGKGLDHQLRRAVGGAEHGGGEKQALDVVAAIEADGQLSQLARRKGSAPYVV